MPSLIWHSAKSDLAAVPNTNPIDPARLRGGSMVGISKTKISREKPKPGSNTFAKPKTRSKTKYQDENQIEYQNHLPRNQIGDHIGGCISGA